MVRVLILRTAGTNCNLETAVAFEKCGAEVDQLHINALTKNKKALRDYQILALPGGFSYGDDIASGKILANELKHGLNDELRKFIEAQKIVIGICNGFQVLVKSGILPGFEKETIAETPIVSLTHNDSHKFECRWVSLKVVSDLCPFAKKGEILEMPVAHGEGKFIPGDERIMQKLRENTQIIFKYVDDKGEGKGYPANPNGSLEDVAGICSANGRVLGLMPHPERYVEPYHHPRWTREGLRPEGDGLRIFRRAVETAAQL